MKRPNLSWRATREQHAAISTLNDEDQAKVLDWIENPRALYPLAENETVLERAMGIVISERQEKEWAAALKKDEGQMAQSWARGRRGAVVAAHFDGFVAGGDGDGSRVLDLVLRGKKGLGRKDADADADADADEEMKL